MAAKRFIEAPSGGRTPSELDPRLRRERCRGGLCQTPERREGPRRRATSACGPSARARPRCSQLDEVKTREGFSVFVVRGRRPAIVPLGPAETTLRHPKQREHARVHPHVEVGFGDLLDDELQHRIAAARVLVTTAGFGDQAHRVCGLRPPRQGFVEGGQCAPGSGGRAATLFENRGTATYREFDRERSSSTTSEQTYRESVHVPASSIERQGDDRPSHSRADRDA